VIIVDSSIWIAFFRGTNPDSGIHLQNLLDQDAVALAAPVRVELLAGASRKTLPLLRRLLSALPLYFPEKRTWGRIENWIEESVTRGTHFGMGDLLIAAIASDYGASVWSQDKDFQRMAHLGWIKLHVPDKSSTLRE
jgi:predicted nucleic acid-binding protein